MILCSYLIAIGCLHFASIVKNQDLSVWLGGLNICTEEVIQARFVLQNDNQN